MYAALRATSGTLRRYLEQYLASGSDDLAAAFAAGGAMRVLLYTPEEMSDRAEGLSLWLYRVVRDDQTLNQPRNRLEHRLEHTPLPLRLHYLMTPIVNVETENSAELEQLILGKTLQAMHDHPLFRGVALRDEFSGSDVEFRARLETLTLNELAEVWEALEQAYQLSVSYEVAVINIDSAREHQSYAPVDDVNTDAGIGIIVGPEEAAL
jgi:hypothetical protein